ncbi:MAG: Asp-tRNA(Asn)/Glu-tRNA(Gln) amidotransferase GatCAB subunit B, partial [Candidatus Latescibacteria bacterium]|nr:Asp-tRNA(Asn)/Glu-tRNA(Gln) amidotransferase GatCAB subunit B [Candidatus Latescibacterota bacterium]
AKTVFEDMTRDGGDPRAIVREKGLVQISDKSELDTVIRKIIEEHPDEVGKFRAGRTKLMAFFVGQVMKATRGKANPQEANAILKEYLG